MSRAWLLFALATLVGCSSSSSPADAGSSPCAGDFLNSTAANACPISCSADVTPVADEGRIHVPFGTQVTYHHNPPASGPHWPEPAPWGSHGEVVPRPWWVHNLEHGGIVLLYNCPPVVGQGDGGETGCPSEVAQFESLWATHAPTHYGDILSEVKILVTADPLLPKRFAAVAWDWVWMSDQLDLSAIQCLIDARYDRGPENAP